jgi:DNA-binding GntR family transcriptional regulator
MANLVYQKLEMAILTGNLKPRERLIEKELASQFRVSRFSIRKTIQELARRGLAEMVPNKGARVIDTSDKEVEDSFLVRMNLELLAADLIVKRMTPQKLTKIKKIQTDYVKAVSIRDFEKMIFKNEEFHRSLYQATENKFLCESLENVTNAIFSRRYNAYFVLGVAPKTVKDHEAMIKAIEKKDVKKLKRLLQDSIINPNMIMKSRER